MNTRRGMVFSALVVILTMLFAVSVYGEEKAADDMTIVKDAIKANKKLFVSENMKRFTARRGDSEKKSKGYK